MSEETKMYVSTLNFRPRIKGKAVLIKAGTQFEKSIIDEHTLNAFVKTGEITEVKAAEAVIDADFVYVPDKSEADKGPSRADQLKALKVKCLEQFKIKLPQRKLETAQAAYDDLVAANAPKGFFNMKVEDLEDKELDELDVMQMTICAENGLEAPQPFEDIEQAIDKLTGEFEG